MIRLQFVILVFAIITIGNAKAQTNNYVISGKVDSGFNKRYAFLYVHDRGITLSRLITGSVFNFKLEKSKKFETAIVYFGPDSTLKFTEVHANRSPSIVEQLDIVLEDSVYIRVNNNLKLAKIVGGKLNRDLLEMKETIKSGEYLKFFTTHPTSPVSIVFLRALSKFKNTSVMFGDYLDIELYFSKLSEDLRRSSEGIELWNSITK